MRFTDTQTERALAQAARLAEKRGHRPDKWTRPGPPGINRFQSTCSKCGQTMYWSGYGSFGKALETDCEG